MGLGLQQLTDAYDHIARSLAAAAPMQIEQSARTPPAAGCSGDILEKWLAALDAEIGRLGLGGIALLLDEVEDLFDKPWHHDFMAFLRRLDGQIGSRIWILICGSDSLHRYRNPGDGSPALNVLRRVFILDLEFAARRRMIAEPFLRAGRLPPADDVVRVIDREAGGQVSILTLMLEKLFKCESADEGAADRVAGELLEDLDSTFERWAHSFDEETWKLYGNIAKQGKVDASYFETNMGRRLRRQLLEFHSLMHRMQSGKILLGPQLFRRWAEGVNKIEGPFESGPDPSANEGDPPPGYWKYDVALSFAAPERSMAAELATLLRQQDIRVFYDQEASYQLWGEDLARFLPETFDRRARITVLLVSEEYAVRRWPKVETAAALVKAMREGWNALLLVSVDGSRLPDVPDSVVFMDLPSSRQTLANVALALVSKLR